MQRLKDGFPEAKLYIDVVPPEGKQTMHTRRFLNQSVHFCQS